MWKKLKNELEKSEDKNFLKAFIAPLKVEKETNSSLVLSSPSNHIITILEKNNFPKKISLIANTIFNYDLTVKFKKRVEQTPPELLQEKLPVGKKTSEKKRCRENKSLNKFYTFDNFVPGPSNYPVFAAAKSISQSPGSHYNPFVIYASTGLGKTHILHAIGNHIIDKKNSSVFYITAQQLMNDYISALSSQQINSFRSKILGYDTLLLDDIQFFSGKRGTQNEFFYIFNKFHEQGKQIVLTSDKYPGEIKDIDDRLRSRFTMGVILDIKPPEYETRIAIVKKKCILYNLKTDENVIEFIAKNIKENVRKIEGALKTLEISSDLMGEKIISISFAKKVLKDFIVSKKDITVGDILKLTATYLDIPLRDITSKKRSKKISLCRQIAMFLSKKYTNMTLKEIGNQFNGRSHATVLTSIKKIEKNMMDDPSLKSIINKLERKIEENI